MIEELLAELRRRQVKIWSEGSRLKYEAPAGALDAACMELLRQHREQILDRLGSAVRAGTAAIPLIDRSQPLPLSFAQQRMWLQWKSAPHSPAYNIAFVVKFTDRVDIGRLAAAITQIRRRHEILRTRFLETPDGPVAVVDADEPFGLPIEDVRAETTPLRHMRKLAREPFDLSRHTAMAVRLYYVDEGQHWLFIKMHHIVADVCSVAIFLRELGAYYQSSEADFPEPSLQYIDFAAWDRSRLEGERRQRLVDYWRRQLEGAVVAPRLADLHADRTVDTAGARVTFQVPYQLSAQLAHIGSTCRATLFMVLTSAFRILLHRYTGQQDILIGTPVICRSEPGTEQLIGYFGNTLPLRNPLNQSDSYTDVLIRERHTALDAYAHQELPFEILVDALTHGHPPGPMPLSVMISFAESTLSLPPMSEVRAQVEEVETGTAKFDLLLSIHQSDEGLSGVFEYSAQLFDRRMVERMAKHFQLLLDDMAKHPAGRIGAILLQTQVEQDLLLRTWNRSETSYAPECCLHELIEAQAAATPDAVAVYFGNAQVSYAELNLEANRIAARLLLDGPGEGKLVAVCLPRTPRLIATLLGILKSGAAYVPLDPKHPSERLAMIIAECKPSLLLTEPASSFDIGNPYGKTLSLEQEATPSNNPGLQLSPRSLAYVLYTSGSSGPPKGVMVEHCGAAALIAWAHRNYSVEDLSIVLAATSVCFDLSVFEIFAPLCAGHSLLLASDIFSVPQLPRYDSVTLINTVPSVMRVLLDVCAFPAALRVVNLAGEPLAPALVDRVYRETGASKVFDLYGPTEATTYSTCKLRRPGAAASIGRPIADNRCYVLDQFGLPVPIGVTGELYLAGAGLARGYLGRPELTAAAFAAPASNLIPEERLYRTGDLTRYTEDGELEYRGRSGEQIKLRGFRIEPAEIRAAILRVDGVDDAWVAPRSGGTDEIELVAYVIASRQPFSTRGLRRQLRKMLPEHMVPTAFVRIDTLPLTSSGKLDLERLAEIGVADPDAASMGAVTATEQRLLEVCQELLGLEHIDIHDSFFDLGGHSLKGMRLVARIAEMFGVQLSVQALFEHPSVASIAAEIDRANAAALPTGFPPLRPRTSQGGPATLVQRHLWLCDLMLPNAVFLNIASSFALRGPLDVDAAVRCLQALAERHPILRARFHVRNGKLWQEISKNGAVEVRVVDVSAPTVQERRCRLEAIYADAAGPFDLERGPCARFVVARFSADDHIVVMVAHHIVADEWSLGVLGRQFVLEYSARVNGRARQPPPPALTFFDFAAWQQECLASAHFDPQILYWKSVFSTPLQRLDLGWRADDGALPEEVESYPIAIEPQLCTRLAALASEAHTSLFVVLLCAFKRLLQRRSGASDIRVATNMALRDQPGLDEMVGPLSDTLVLRTKLDASMPPLVALRRVRESFAGASVHHDVPFEVVAQRVCADTAIVRKDLAQAFFLLDEAVSDARPFAGLTVEPTAIEAQSDFFKSAPHDYDLILHLTRSDERLVGQITLKGQLGDGSLPEDILSTYRALLEELAAHANIH
ncbi:amino acid adenylation domain-containing protein (plasmid) [Rhizobium leguminosarum]